MSDKDLQNPCPSLPGDVKTTGSAPAPIAWYIADDNGEVYAATGYEHERDGWRSVGHVVYELYAAPPANAPVASVLTDWQHRCAVLVDIYDDARNNAPEDRCYIDGAFTAEMDEVRALLAASMGGDRK